MPAAALTISSLSRCSTRAEPLSRSSRRGYHDGCRRAHGAAPVPMQTERGEFVIRHIVMWKLKESAEGATRAENVVKFKALLEGCRDLGPGPLPLEVGVA